MIKLILQKSRIYNKNNTHTTQKLKSVIINPESVIINPESVIINPESVIVRSSFSYSYTIFYLLQYIQYTNKTI